jgi:MFS family permease
MSIRQREMATVSVLSVSWALVIFDMTGVDFLMPFLAPSLKLSNTQIGLLFALYFIPFGLSSYVTGELSDRLGQRRPLYVAAMLLFSLVSVLPAFATSFTSLLTTRLVVGLLAGPILPLAQTIVAVDYPAERRGMNMGIVQNVGASLLGFVAPILLVAIAVRWGWNRGFFVIVVPGLICAALIALLLRSGTEPKSDGAADGRDSPTRHRKGVRDLLRNRNVWLCVIAACLFTAFVVIGKGYLPLYFVRVRHMSPQRMGVLMSLLSVSGLALGILFPALGDRIGRKPVAIISSLLGAVFPLGGIFFQDPTLSWVS